MQHFETTFVLLNLALKNIGALTLVINCFKVTSLITQLNSTLNARITWYQKQLKLKEAVKHYSQFNIW